MCPGIRIPVLFFFLLDLKLLHQNETQANPSGLVLPFSSHKYLCSGFCFGLHLGEILVEHFGFNMVQTIHSHDASNDAWNAMWYLDNSFAVLLPKHVDSLVAGVQCSTKVFQLRIVICTVPCIRKSHNSWQHLAVTTQLLLPAWMEGITNTPKSKASSYHTSEFH